MLLILKIVLNILPIIALVPVDRISSIPVVILPGFGNDCIDYINPLNKGSTFSIKTALEKRGCSVTVLPIKRASWLNIAKGAFDKKFWSYECRPEELYNFYMKQVDSTIREVVDKEKSPVIVIGHSAGGWLARACMADGKWFTDNSILTSELILGLCTLGTPHIPPIGGNPDMTRGALTFVHKNYPDAFLKERLFYITVAGTSVASNLKGNAFEKFAADSYPQVSGIDEFNQIGDGVVPLSCAHISGSIQINIPGFIYFHILNNLHITHIFFL